MALQLTYTKDGITYENAYVRAVVNRIYKRNYITQTYQPAISENAEIPEIKEWKMVMTLAAYIYSWENNSKWVNPIEIIWCGEIVYWWGDAILESYNYLKTLEIFENSLDI